MGVNWQKNDYYSALKDQERITGLSVADRNRINNPFGSHTFLGVLGTQLLPQIFNFSEQALGTGLNGSSQTGSATNVPSSDSDLKNFEAWLKKYNEAKANGDKDNKLKQYAQELDRIRKEHDNENGNPTIRRCYTTDFKAELKRIINS